MELFVGFIELVSDKTATTMKSRALVAYPVHYNFVNVAARRRE